MVHETDLPCSDCGTDLDRRFIDARAVFGPSCDGGTVLIAACPDCEARYVPERSLVRLRELATGAPEPEVR